MTAKQRRLLVSRVVSLASAVLFVVLFSIAIIWANGLRLDFNRRTVEQTGMIAIDDRDPLVKVYLNDRLIGNGIPRQIRGLSFGPYNIRIEKEGFEALTRKINLDPGEAFVISEVPLFASDIKSTIIEVNSSPRFIERLFDVGLYVNSGDLYDADVLVGRLSSEVSLFRRFGEGYIYQTKNELRVFYPEYGLDRVIYQTSSSKPVMTIIDTSQQIITVKDGVIITRLYLGRSSVVEAVKTN